MADINAVDLTPETVDTLDGTEHIVMFDTAEGKKATLTVIGNYILKKLATINSATVETILSGKVDKVTGKALSTNDLTNALKDKLDDIEAGAEVNQDAFAQIACYTGTQSTGTLTASSESSQLAIRASSGNVGVAVQSNEVVLTSASPASVVPSANGTASTGLAEGYAREDHVHPVDIQFDSTASAGTTDGDLYVAITTLGWEDEVVEDA